MCFRTLLKSFTACLIATLLVGLATQSTAWAQQSLKMLILEDLTEMQVQSLIRMGLDIAAIRKGEAVEGPSGLPSYKMRVEAVASPADRERLTAEGFRWTELAAPRPQPRSLDTFSDAPPVFPNFDTSDTNNDGVDLNRNFSENWGRDDEGSSPQTASLIYGAAGVPGYTVELTPGVDSAGNFYGFVFPADEGLLQTVFEDNLEFALSVIESAQNPAHPVSSTTTPMRSIAAVTAMTSGT